MSEDMLLDNNVAVINSDSNGKEVEDSDKTWNFSFWNFITKPLSLFSDEDTQANSESEGKKETYMEKNIRLANEGKLDAQMNLGYMYLYGINGVEVDFDKAFQYYTLAAAQKDPIALNNLGSLYFSGIGTKTNVQKAAELFAEAANNGNDNAAVNLAFIYLVGGAKDKQRNQKAVTLFQQAADLGNNIAKFMLGYAYYKGFAVEQNYQKAYELVKAAAGGNSRIDEAQMVLGEMLIEGNGTVQNFHDGINALRAAVMQGNMEAFLVVAKIYAEGSFVPRNPILAHALYNIAASRNVAGAAKMREDIAKTLTREQLSAAQKQAQNFKDNPSELTLYIRQTFGPNIRDYIHNNM
jgi:TPR repeat protein